MQKLRLQAPIHRSFHISDVVPPGGVVMSDCEFSDHPSLCNGSIDSSGSDDDSTDEDSSTSDSDNDGQESSDDDDDVSNNSDLGRLADFSDSDSEQQEEDSDAQNMDVSGGDGPAMNFHSTRAAKDGIFIVVRRTWAVRCT